MKKLKKTILVVEDDESIAELLVLILEQQGYSVEVMNNGLKAEKRVKSLKPHLILVDFLIPGITGGQLAKRLKKNPATKHIPVIIVSAQNSLRATANAAGADGFLAKPFNIHDLAALVKAHLS